MQGWCVWLWKGRNSVLAASNGIETASDGPVTQSTVVSCACAPDDRLMIGDW